MHHHSVTSSLYCFTISMSHGFYFPTIVYFPGLWGTSISDFCNVLTTKQRSQLATPFYKIKKEKKDKKSDKKDTGESSTLRDPSQVSI